MKDDGSKQTNGKATFPTRLKGGSLHDRFWRGVTSNEAFNALLYARVYGTRRFVQNIEIRAFKAINSDLISNRMKTRVADGFFNLEYVERNSPTPVRTRPVLLEHKFHKELSTWIQVGEYLFLYLRDVANAIKSDPSLKKDYCVDGKIIAPTAIILYCGYEPWDFEKERIGLEIPPELGEFNIDFRCEFVSVRDLNADDFADLPVLQTLILLMQAVADPKTRKEDAERVFAPVFDSDEFEQWKDVLGFYWIYWVEALESKGIRLTPEEILDLIDRIKDGKVRKEVKMFTEIYAADVVEKLNSELTQALAREKDALIREKDALAREKEAEGRATQYLQELNESRQFQDDFFWDLLSLRFPSMPMATSKRIRQVANYPQTLLGAAATASSVEDFNMRLDACLAKS